MNFVDILTDFGYVYFVPILKYDTENQGLET